MKKNNIKRMSLPLGRVILGLIVCSSTNVKSQYVEQFAISAANGNKMLELKNYQEGVRQFSALHKKEKGNLDYQYKLGKCYNYSFIDKKKGLELLEELSKSADKPKGTDFELGVAYFKNYQFKAARKTFSALKLTESDEEKKAEIEKWIEQCETSEELFKHPVPVSFENLGKNVNSKAPDFLPLCLPNESTVTFTTKRSGVVGNLYDYGGYRTADIFTSKHKRNKYSRARSIGSPNTYGNEATAGRSENGKYFVYSVNSNEHFNDLFVSELGKRSFMPPKIFDSKEVNKKSAETGATLTNDGTKMYFSSDREGGLGGFDIYMVQRLPNGKWGIPKNIGAPINTKGDEKYPMLIDEGKTLYFSSNGHPGMGDLDLFKSQMKNEKWSNPENLGFPVNTVDDDYNITFAKNKRHAYIAAKRDGGFGDLDIYRITFLKEKSNYTLLKGQVLNSDSAIVQQEISVEVFNTDDDEIEGTYKVNQETGKFSAVIAPGSYRIEITEAAGFKEFSKNIRLHGKNDFQETIEMVLVLTPD